MVAQPASRYRRELGCGQNGRPAANLLASGRTSFGIVFLAEWGDITQLTAANLAARYNPLVVFGGATLGLWAVAALAITVGSKSLSVLPMSWIQRITATILLGFGVYSAIAAITG